MSDSIKDLCRALEAHYQADIGDSFRAGKLKDKHHRIKLRNVLYKLKIKSAETFEDQFMSGMIAALKAQEVEFNKMIEAFYQASDKKTNDSST